jgi:hypothetical protein
VAEQEYRFYCAKCGLVADSPAAHGLACARQDCPGKRAPDAASAPPEPPDDDPDGIIKYG